MPFELHADFDRDGRISGSQAERAARGQFPGAVLVANLDYDRRTLDPSPGSPSPVPPDAAASLPGQDDELVALEIRGNPGDLGAGERLELRVSGVMHVRLILQDRHGSLVPHAPGRPEAFMLPAPTSATLPLWLSVRTIAGARFDRISSLETSFRVDLREERDFTLTLVRVDARGNANAEDRGAFSVSPAILDDRLSPPRRIYIVDKDEDNLPTRRDVAAAARAAGVPLLEVPAGLTGGDTWFQDQFQHAYMEGPSRIREIVLHLPRMRSDNSLAIAANNLGTFVAGHFRAADIALFEDLWERIVVAQDAQGRAFRASFRSLYGYVGDIRLINRVADHLNALAASLLRRWDPIQAADWITVRRQLRAHLRRLQNALETETADDNLPADLARSVADAAEHLVEQVESRIRIPGGAAGRTSLEVTIGGQRLTLSDAIAGRLAARAIQMHGGANYGGNIESTPPVPSAPLGKIIVGNVEFEDRSEFMDPDVLGLLVKQRKQPIVEIDTSWLQVGHIDEMVSVVPHGTDRFSFLHASSAAAITLLRLAETRHRAGRGEAPLGPDNRRMPRGSADRLMDGGSVPLTRLFRGKAWLQVQPSSPDADSGIIEPPRIFLRIAGVYGRRQLEAVTTIGSRTPPQPGIGFDPSPTGGRRYPADITPTEVLWAETGADGESSNDAIDASVLATSRRVLAAAFPNVPILPVPVLFDNLHDPAAFREGRDRSPTTAFTPNMANMQVLNRHILVPRPYGPRMRPKDAVPVVVGAMDASGMPASVRGRVGPRLIAAHRLAGPQRIWVERFDEVSLHTPGGSVRTTFRGFRLPEHVIEMFRDSFPNASESDLNRQIVQPNRRVITHFGGASFRRLVYGPVQLEISDGMVDLFELWMAAIAAELSVTLHFVDTWFYHLRDGQVHCGTNVLRRPARMGRPPAYEVQDAPFRSLDFEAEVIEAV